jgi:hypothetical protein
MSSLRAAQRDWLARHHAKLRLTAHHRNSVHNPSHRLLVRVNVRRRDVSVRPYDGSNLESIATRQAFKLAPGKAFGVADHSSLAAAVRDADRGALPSHPRGQGFDFIYGHVRVVAYAALGGAARDVVLHAIALEDLYVAAVHLDGDGDYELSFRVAQDVAHGSFKLKEICGAVELLPGNLEGIEFLCG